MQSFPIKKGVEVGKGVLSSLASHIQEYALSGAIV